MIDRNAIYVTFTAQVALQALYKQVGTLLPNGRARHTLRLRAMRAPTATESEKGTLATVLLTVNALRPSPWIVQYYFPFFLHNTHYLKMLPTIQSPAPTFSVTSLADGALKQVSANGTYPSFFLHWRLVSDPPQLG